MLAKNKYHCAVLVFEVIISIDSSYVHKMIYSKKLCSFLNVLTKLCLTVNDMFCKFSQFFLIYRNYKIISISKSES